ncbi:MAG: hypothetical protein Q7T71_12585 [Herbiconiux sp.]|nr:hypothetical protein [Herbiconiux sp.]
MGARTPAGLVALIVGASALLGGCTGAPDAGPSGAVSPSAVSPGSTDAGASDTDPTGTGDGTDSGTGTDTVPEPTPAIPAYTVEQLRQIVIDSGYACGTFTPATIETGTGGWCAESSLGVFVFPRQDDIEALLERSAGSSEPQPFLVGARWVVTSSNPATSGDELVALQDIIGGALVGPDL